MSNLDYSQVAKLKDPKFYLENFCKIKGKTPGLVPFILNEAQKDLFNTIKNDNRVIILKARQIGFCLHEDTKILTSDLNWVNIKDISIGDKVIAVDENIPERGKQRKMRTAIVQNKFIFDAPALKLTMDDGRILIATAEHKMLSRKHVSGTEMAWKKIKDLPVGSPIRSITQVWGEASPEDGWFAGMIDGEGSLSLPSRSGACITVSQVDGLVYQRLLKYVNENNIKYRIEIDKRVAGLKSKLGNKVVYKIVISQMDKIFHLLGKTKPVRFSKREWWVGKSLPNDGWAKIVKIEDAGMCRMVDLQTSEHTYIAGGLVSHNSTATTGYFYHNTIMTPGTTTALIGYNSDLTSELLDKVKTFYRSTPDDLKPSLQYNSKYEISFPKIDSKIIVLPSTENVGRGYTLHNVLCLSGDTNVYLANGEEKKIKLLKSGEKILNGAGGHSNVKMVISRENKEKLFMVESYGNSPLVLTGDHKIFVRVKNNDGGEWKKTSELSTSDYVAYPYWQLRNRKKEVTVNNSIKPGYESRSLVFDKIKLTNDFAEFCGWYISEGSASGGKIQLSINKKEIRYVTGLLDRSIADYITSYSVNYTSLGGAVITIYGTLLANFLKENFGHGCQNKTIDNKIWYWGWGFGYYLLRGIILGDGYLKDKKKIVIVTTSLRLANQIKRLMVSLRLGLPSIKKSKTSRYGKENLDRYDIHIGGKGNYKIRRKLKFELPIYNNGRARYRLENNPGINQGGGYWKRGKFYYWSKVKKISVVPAEDRVYDIVLDSSPHSFVANGVVVHNCTELSAWEKADEKMMVLEASVPITGKIVVESCVSGDTMVLTSDGPRYVKDIHDWDNNPLGFSEGKRIEIDGHWGVQPTTTYYNSGIQKGFKIKTRLGLELGMSSVHKMFVLSEDKLEFVKASDLRIGDHLPLKHGQNLWGSNDKVDWVPTPYQGKNKQHIKLFNPDFITTDLAYLIGLIIGDGYVDFSSGRVIVTTIDKEISDFLLSSPLGLNFFGGKGDNYYHYTCSNDSFVEFLSSYIGLKKVKAPQKEIPKIIFSWSKELVASFFQGLFDADGSCRSDRREVSLTSTSKNIVSTTQLLLLNFGILSRIYSYNAKPSKKVKVWSSGYKLEISRYYSSIFLDEIGFRIKRKQNAGKIINHLYRDPREIPGIGKIIKKNKKELQFLFSDVSSFNRGLFSKSGNITYPVLRKILDKCENKKSDIYKRINNLIEKDYYYDEIVSITPMEDNVYDFSVDNGHTVVYNGLVGHQTPRGQGNLYHRMWMADDNGYAKKEYGWWWIYSEEEIELIKKRMNNPLKFAQEYGLEFLASGRPVFDPKAVEKQRANQLKEGDVFKTKDGEDSKVVVDDMLTVYVQPKPGKFYVVGVDVAEGVDGGDYSVCTIFDRSTGEEVAFYRGQVPPDIYSGMLNRWGRKYNNALMVVEVNNHGLTTLTVLKQLLYPSLYFRPAKFETIASPWSDKLGWKTTKLTRPLLIDDFAQAIRDDVITLHSKELINEMSVFVYDSGNNMVPMEGFHDDCIFAAGICFQGFKVLYDKPLDQLNYENHLPISSNY
jgi:hypothetical protein